MTPVSSEKYRLKIVHSIADIPRHEWEGLSGGDALPFLDWDWLNALEESRSIAPETGWYPLHLSLWRGESLVAAAPLYLKTNSEGEYVYDYFWAEAAYSMGIPWYPKLVGTCAATPAEGYRFLWKPDVDGGLVTGIFLKAAETLAQSNGVKNLNFLFADPGWEEFLENQGYTPWEHSHYLWENPGYRDFEDYLARFNKYQRKNIRKEYSRRLEQDISVRIIPGEEASPEHYRRMFDLFTITNDKFAPWDARWVNQDFFRLLEKNCRRKTLFVEARWNETSPGRIGAAEEDGLIALALLVRQGKRIWGRFWGAYEEVRDLHFTACYYVPMDWAIREGIESFDPGAGSSHKIHRGFRAVRNRSWHKFFDPSLARLFKNNIRQVNRMEAERLAELNTELPFKLSGTETN